MYDSDKCLAEKCVSGDKTAWDYFIRKYADLIRRVIHSCLRRFHSVENLDEFSEKIFQELFLSLREDNCRRLAQYRGENGCSLGTWLCVVVSRLTIDHLRKCGPAHISIDDIMISQNRFSPMSLKNNSLPPEKDYENKQTIGVIRKEINNLPPKDKLIVKLLFDDELSYQEASKIVGIKTGALYTRVSRIREKIKKVAHKEFFL